MNRPEINSDIELVQILIYLADVKDMTRQSLNNLPYCSAIDKWFSKYKGHEAVMKTRDLIINKHFNFTRPHMAALRLSEINESDGDDLFDWANEVKRFWLDTKYHEFIQQQSPYYGWILNTLYECKLDDWISYTEHYFDRKPDEFHLIICPLDGNYGFNLNKPSGEVVSYSIRCMPYYKDGNPIWQFDYFAKGFAHEYAHCFVNPVVESQKELLSQHQSFFDSHINMPDFYNTNYAVINEYFVRAFAIRFMEEFAFDGFDIKAEYERQRANFTYIDTFVKELKEYENSGGSFEVFYSMNIDRILSQLENKC